MKSVKVLGTGCANCIALEKKIREIVAEHHIEATVEKVDDLMKIIAYGVRRTPAIVIDEKVVAYGHVPSGEEILQLLSGKEEK